MNSRITGHIRRFLSGLMGVGIALILLSTSAQPSVAFAHKAVLPPTGNYYSVNTIEGQDGTLIEKHSINGPSVPPVGFEGDRQPVAAPDISIYSGSNSSGGGGDAWVLGCSATAAGDVITYYDQSRYPNLYTGQTGNGVLPVGSNPWPTFLDAEGVEMSSHPVIASKKGLDGRVIFGTIDDYYISYESPLADPYLGYGGGNTFVSPQLLGALADADAATGGWAQHTWGDAVGDFMYTSQSAFGNVDGETQFYTYANSATPFTCEEMSENALPDGTLGIKQFYQARGYAVGACYNQPTDNVITGGFSFAKLKMEIDASRPVILNLEGHTVTAVGYEAATNTVYIHDGWDYATHLMPWGGSYAGMALQSVSIVNIVAGAPAHYTISGNAGIPDATITYTGGFTTTDANGNYSFTVTESWFGTVTPSKAGYNFTPPNRAYRNVKENRTAQNYFVTDSDFPVSFGKTAPANGVTNQPNVVELSWETSIGAGWYEYCIDDSNDNNCTNWQDNDTSTEILLGGFDGNTTYYWQVRAVNSSGETYANGSETAFWSFKTAASTPFQVTDAWTGDGNEVEKTLFRPGEPIQWIMDVENSTGVAQTATFAFHVKGPTGAVLLNWQGNDTLDDGYWFIWFDDTTPNVEGVYTFTGSVIYQGIQTTQSTTYTVAYPCYPLTTSVVGNGSINVNPPPNCFTDNTKYRQGTIVQLTAAPYGGHGFDGWSGPLAGSPNPTTVDMSTGKSVTANFSLRPPVAPQLISPSNGVTLEDLSPTLVWNDLAFTPDQYQMQFSTKSDFSSGVTEEFTTATSYTILDPLIPGKTYYWHVRASNSAGDGAWSPTWVVSIKPPPVSLSKPDPDQHSPTLRPPFDWSDVPNIGMYTLQISTNTAFTPLLVDESSETSDFTLLDDLPPAQTLYWRVRSESGGGPSNWSVVRSFTTPNPPSVPLLLTPYSDSVTPDLLPLFKWNPVRVPGETEFDHYQIQVSTDNSFSSLAINNDLTALSTRMFAPETNLAANTTYYWRMRAFNTDDESSSWTEVRSFRTPVLIPDNKRMRVYSLDPALATPVIIAPLSGGSLSAAQPRLDWADAQGATSYIVQISTDPLFTSTSMLVSSTTIESQYIFVKDIPTNTLLYWRVLAVHENSLSNWSEVAACVAQ